MAVIGPLSFISCWYFTSVMGLFVFFMKFSLSDGKSYLIEEVFKDTFHFLDDYSSDDDWSSFPFGVVRLSMVSPSGYL